MTELSDEMALKLDALRHDLGDDEHQLSEEWSRADAAFSALGIPTPRAMPDEPVGRYRRRVTKLLQRFSPAWRGADLSVLAFPDAGDGTFKKIADQVRADALQFATDPATAPQGELRMVSRVIDGHTHNTFVGDPNAWMNQFAGPVKLKARGTWQYAFGEGGEVITPQFSRLNAIGDGARSAFSPLYNKFSGTRS